MFHFSGPPPSQSCVYTFNVYNYIFSGFTVYSFCVYCLSVVLVCYITGFAFMSAIVLQFLDGNVLRKW